MAWIVILLLAVASRFYMLGDRAVSHDETTHALFSWNLYTERGFKHDPRGEHLLSWGRFGQVAAYDPAGQGVFFGPRGIAVGPDGNIYVSDTGNKRVQVFDASGNFLREFGGAGAGPG